MPPTEDAVTARKLCQVGRPRSARRLGYGSRGCVWQAVLVQCWCYAQVSEDGCPTSCQDEAAVPAGAKARVLTGLDPTHARCSVLVAPDTQKAGGEPCDVAMAGAEVETCIQNSQDTQADEAGGFRFGVQALWFQFLPNVETCHVMKVTGLPEGRSRCRQWLR